MVERATPTIGGFDDEGYWVITKHADVREVSRHSDVFSSRENRTIPRLKIGGARQYVEMSRLALINMDVRQHTQLRQIVSRSFTPRVIQKVRDELSERTQSIARTAGPQALVTLSSKCPLSCPCKRSPVYFRCRGAMVESYSTGQTR
jgi:cytochrome P450